MTVIVTDDGFGRDDWTGAVTELDPGADPRDAAMQAKLIRVTFPNFADGRGFTLARLLRIRGYRGRLRAAGHLLADQYAMARRAGFDEVEISQQMAARQPEAQWLARADWRAHDYQARMRHG